MRFVAFALALAMGAGAWAHETGTTPAERSPALGTAPAQAGAQSPIASHPRLNVIAPAPDFALRDPAGDLVRLSDMRGKIVLVAFIYTFCTTTCPILSQQMATIQRNVKRDKQLSGRVMLVSVTVDPSRDTAPVLAHYASALGAETGSWKFLRDTPEALAPTLVGYHEWTKPLPNGELDHPARVYLIDAEGRIREIYSLAFFDPRQALIDIRSLAAPPP